MTPPPIVDEKYKAKVREKIIQRAIQLFSTKGYYQTRMSDIVTKKISKGTIYNYFDSKKELYLAVQESLDNNWLEIINSPLISAENTTEKLRKLIKFLFKIMLNTPQKDKIATFETIGLAFNDNNKEILESIRKNHSVFLELASKLLKEGKETGEFKEIINIEEFAGIIISAIEGIQLLSAVQNKEYNGENIGEYYSKWIINEIKI